VARRWHGCSACKPTWLTHGGTDCRLSRSEGDCGAERREGGCEETRLGAREARCCRSKLSNARFTSVRKLSQRPKNSSEGGAFWASTINQEQRPA